MTPTISCPGTTGWLGLQGRRAAPPATGSVLVSRRTLRGVRLVPTRRLRQLRKPTRTGKTVDGGYAEVVVQPRPGGYRCLLRHGWSCMRRSAVMPVGLIAGVVRAVVGVDQHRCCAERGIEWRASGLALFGHSA